jgi:hypothetical protein
MVLELCLHHNRPNVHSKVECHHGAETELCTPALADAFQVENETKTEASDDTEEGRDKRGEGASSNGEVRSEIG